MLAAQVGRIVKVPFCPQNLVRTLIYACIHIHAPLPHATHILSIEYKAVMDDVDVGCNAEWMFSPIKQRHHSLSTVWEHCGLRFPSKVSLRQL